MELDHGRRRIEAPRKLPVLVGRELLLEYRDFLRHEVLVDAADESRAGIGFAEPSRCVPAHDPARSKSALSAWSRLTRALVRRDERRTGAGGHPARFRPGVDGHEARILARSLRCFPPSSAHEPCANGEKCSQSCKHQRPLRQQSHASPGDLPAGDRHPERRRPRHLPRQGHERRQQLLPSPTALAVELAAQALQPPAHVGAHGVHGHAQALRDRARREVIEKAQADRGAVGLLQMVDGVEEPVQELELGAEVGGAGLGLVAGGTALAVGAAGLVALHVQGKVLHRAREPGADPGWRSALSQRGEPRFLDDVLSAVAVVDEAAREAAQPGKGQVLRSFHDAGEPAPRWESIQGIRVFGGGLRRLGRYLPSPANSAGGWWARPGPALTREAGDRARGASRTFKCCSSRSAAREYAALVLLAVEPVEYGLDPDQVRALTMPGGDAGVIELHGDLPPSHPSSGGRSPSRSFPCWRQRRSPIASTTTSTPMTARTTRSESWMVLSAAIRESHP